MHVNKDTTFVDLTNPNSSGSVVGFYMDENFVACLITRVQNSYSSCGYPSAKMARGVMRNRRYVGGSQCPTNTVYLINMDNPVLQSSFRNLIGQ